MKKFLFLLLVLALLGIAGFAVQRTFQLKSRQVVPAAADPLALDMPKVIERLAGGLRLQTISPRADNGQALRDLGSYLVEVFPGVHAASGGLKHETVAEFSHLYTWEGADPARPPVLLMAHSDVVPVDPSSENSWQQPPFGGKVAGGFVWGRGALDDKASLFALFEAVEALTKEGFHPPRTIHLAVGHDEEIGGREGTQAIAELLRNRGTKLDFVLDEGSGITEGLFPGLAAPLAMVGIAEKGYLSLMLSAHGEGGHSSMPPPETTVGIIARAIARLEARPFPKRLTGAAELFVEYAGPELDFKRKLAFTNLWLFKPVLEYALAEKDATRAWLGTTTAPTMFSGSLKDNILPTKATAVVNFRIIPGESIASVIERVHQVIDDPRVEIAPLPGDVSSEPSVISRVDAPGFRAVETTIRQIFPGTVVAPSIVLGATDSRYFGGLSSDVYRFAPIRLTQEDLPRIHGIDERISIAHYESCVRFYYQLIKNLDRPQPTKPAS